MFECRICGSKHERFKTIEGMYSHLEKVHGDEIPNGWSVQQYAYYLKTGKTHGNCVICKGKTKFNLVTGKYYRLCEKKACSDKNREIFKKRMIGKYGKVSLLDDPEQQKKMLANRKISGTYTWSDGKKFTYTGSYELDFLRFLDVFLNFPSQDIECPSPHTYYYEYEGKKHFYIPDVYIQSLNLEIEVKDGGNNPNTHHKIQEVDKIKETLKDKVMLSQSAVSYVKVTNKEYDTFFKYLYKMKDQYNDKDDKFKPIFVLGESAFSDEFTDSDVLLEAMDSQGQEVVFYISSEPKLKTIRPSKSKTYPNLGNIILASPFKEFATALGANLSKDHIKMISTIKGNNLDIKVELLDKYAPVENKFSIYVLSKEGFEPIVKDGEPSKVRYYKQGDAQVIREIKVSNWRRYINRFPNVKLINFPNDEEAKEIEKEKLKESSLGMDTFTEIFGEGRDATVEEQQNVTRHIEEISEETGINFWDEPTMEAKSIIEGDREIFTDNLQVTKEYGIYSNNGTYNAIAELKGFTFKCRGRSELIVMKGNKVYLAKNKSGLYGNYSVPGGGWDKNEPHDKSAIREAEEESRLSTKNVQYGGNYLTAYDKPKKWVLEKIPKEDQWRGYYTEVFIGEYSGKFNGHIDEEDKDDIINVGKFYSFDEVKNILNPIHREIIEKYLREKDLVKESVDMELVTEEANYSSTNKYPVFIVLMHSGTTLANVIKAFTRDEFSHACISFNSKLDPLYSFGNKKVNIIDPGFVIQNPDSKFYKRHKAYYNVFVMYVDKASYDKMQEKLQFFIDNKDDLKYDLASLFKIACGKPSEESKKYFCSKFCMNVIGAGRELEKVPSLWKPEDIKGLDDISLVDKGVDFSLYDYRNTEENLKKIKKHQFTKESLEVVEESGKAYFVSTSDSIKKLTPRVPSNYMTENGYEDGKTPRVCFAPSIDKCLMALSQKCTDMELYVYEPDGNYDIYRPSVKEVPDVKITGELWIKEPVKLKKVGKIKVIGDKGLDGHPYKYGDKTAELYDWDWKWVERINESGLTTEDGLEVVDEATSYYRVTYNGNGIYEEYKKLASMNQWKDFKNSEACGWLPVPPAYNDNYTSYFTAKGYEMFRKLTYPELVKVLDESEINIDKIDKLPKPVYKDKYQVVCKESVEMGDLMLESLELYVTKPKYIGKNITLYHASPKRLDRLDPNAPNVGTRLSGARSSSFWIDEPTLPIAFAVRRLIMDLQIENRCQDVCYMIDKETSQIKVSAEDVNNFIKEIKTKKIYLHEKTVPSSIVGRGHGIGIGEFTLDISVVPDYVKEYSYDDFKSFIVFTTEEDIRNTYEMVASSGNYSKFMMRNSNWVERLIYLDAKTYSERSKLQSSFTVSDKFVKDTLIEMNDELNGYGYGIPKNGVISDIPSEKFYYENWKYLSPKEFSKVKGGTCWDYVAYQTEYLASKNIKVRNFYIIDEKGETHTISIITSNGKFYYPESSFKRIHGLYVHKNLKSIFRFVIKEMGIKNYWIYEFKKNTNYGCSCEEYMQWMKEKGKLVLKGKANTLPNIDKIDKLPKPVYKDKYQVVCKESFEEVTGEIMNEAYIKNEKDIYYNKDKFDSGEINLCFITGHSGSGKSTMARNMTNKSNIEHYELDDVIANWNFSDDNLKEYGDLIYSFFKGVGKKFRYKSYEDWSNDSKWDTPDGNGDKYERELTPSFINYCKSYTKSQKDTKIVVEGVWLFHYIEPSELEKYAVYVKGTSLLASKVRAAKRNASPMQTNFAKARVFLRAMTNFTNWKYRLLDEKRITKYRNYFGNKVEKNIKESTLTTEERNVLSSSDYGIPILKKYPMPDEAHVKSAIRFFNYVDEEYEELLAKNIKKKIKEFDMEVNVGKKNRLSKYL